MMDGFIGSLLGVLLAAGIIFLTWHIWGRRHKGGNPIYLDGEKYYLK